MKRAATGWTTPADIRAQVQRLWNRGTLLSAMVTGETLFPLRLLLKGPNSRQLSDHFTEVRDWITQLTAAAGPYRIAWRTVNHRVLGGNDIPSELWIDSMDDALALIGKRRDAEKFASMIELTRKREPALLPWLARRPLRALELAESWPNILRLVEWLRNHPRPGIYLRQIDLAGIHTKFIEAHRGTLSELFDLALPPETIDATATGSASFCQRYGFRDKPLRVRFRLLDPALTLLPGGGENDITLTQADFARLDLPVETVFITENEINFLAFPPVPRAMVIFGAGYGFRNLARIDWLQTRKLHYWGDIDTHGFAILNQFREHFPHATSLLMDRATLLAHRNHWQTEPNPETAELTRLTEAEQSLYDDLRENRLDDGVRLEQEKIGYEMLVEALERR
ncbi:hypothetical protein EST62_07120 [Chlorobaculum sp. 24CR]|uniref:DUF3322 domain-containing protein n=1 Tax=Chlorobaculum sp. 24CR TaxID=2508878 RepID=UPI00100BB2FF|nr:DUF3322 domain-containing protein [Chlorobaculum sp. 24CR]RXK85211.1 hypothetical protein EST62_07120 [Chlorobaculum sp. 24CR]